MSNELQIYRKRLIPEECILLKDDIIVEQNEDYILTKWKTLNPKTTFSHGCSCYYLKEGFKISWSPEESENAMSIARSTLTRQT